MGIENEATWQESMAMATPYTTTSTATCQDSGTARDCFCFEENAGIDAKCFKPGDVEREGKK